MIISPALARGVRNNRQCSGGAARRHRLEEQQMIGRIAGTLAVGAFMLVGGHGAASAAACTDTTVGALETPGFSCDQQDKTWSNFHFDPTGGATALPTDATVAF